MESKFNNLIFEIEPATEEELQPFIPFDTDEERELKVRLDKWLWAARFFKTRALARKASEEGKIYYNGEPSKPSREIELGATLNIRVGRYERTVVVTGLSTRRHNTQKAEELYQESEESRLMREQQTAEWQANVAAGYGPNSTQPNVEFKPKRQVRFLRRAFTRGNDALPTSQPIFEFEP